MQAFRLNWMAGSPFCVRLGRDVITVDGEGIFRATEIPEFTVHNSAIERGTNDTKSLYYEIEAR